MKACIFLDIDGTLLDHEIGIQESSRIAIAQAQANGHRAVSYTHLDVYKRQVQDSYDD